MFVTQFRLGRGRCATFVEHARRSADATGSFHSAKRRIYSNVNAKHERYYSSLYFSASSCERCRPGHAGSLTGPAVPYWRHNGQSCRDTSERLCSYRDAFVVIVIDVEEH